jgi:alkanesulfonate monooxygenase SsuD/methylene tetrahydromethanopterin reductase-like flavin-dependent oxidoreductase (luciferase family)
MIEKYMDIKVNCKDVQGLRVRAPAIFSRMAFMMRFDLRSPDPRLAPDLYRAALEMCEWAEGRGCLAAVVCEHHGSPDGYLPAPMLMAAAIAARTRQLRIMIAALVLPLHDPVRLAEEMAVLDLLGDGRVSYVLAIGYRDEEYRLFGVDRAGRAEQMDRDLAVVLDAIRTGEVDTADRKGPVTPRPLNPPSIALGGRSVAAARRAGRFGLDLIAQNGDPALEAAHRDEADRHGHAGGTVLLADPSQPNALFVADDIDRAWEELGPHLLHDARMYSSWNPGDHDTASLSHATSVDELRAEHGSHRIVTVDEAVELVRITGYLGLHPLCGGIPPEIAWPYLRRVVDEVLPAMAS